MGQSCCPGAAYWPQSAVAFAVALATIAAVLGREAALVIFAATAGPTADDIGLYPSPSRRLAQDSERKQQKKEYQKGEGGLSELRRRRHGDGVSGSTA